ncbi:phage tail protein [Alicyclobacillus herbarius]|uniref:phage tail protein n=1 Tax=Alicyclobacillus herbarius TaxID=122960 RepID=UPI00041928C6|nr:phage tail protein [Alicyclobacillus herbarius]
MQDYPKVYDRSGKLLAVIDKAFSVQIQDQLITETNGQETLTFSLPAYDPKLALFTNEDHVRVGGSEFVIRVMEIGWDSGQGIPTVDVTCEAVWYDLAEYDPITSLDMKDIGPSAVMQAILQGTDWSVGTVEITTPGNFSITDSTNRLAAIRQIPGIYGGELKFDSVGRKVHLLRQVGSDTGFLFAFGKNMKSNKRTVDTRNLVTRLYPYGANNLSIADVNNGVPYIEDYSWYDSTGKTRQVKSATLTNDDITNPSYLLQWAKQQLAVLCQPTISYAVDGVLTPDDPIPGLGDIVTVYDQTLGLNMKARIAKRTIDVLQPENTSLELETALPTLADQLSNIQAGGGSISDVVDAVNQAMQDMVVFNLLLNSRADDGLAYWTADGWTVDNSTGASGSASFICQGASGVTKTLSQTVNPANRQNYTLSAQVALDNVKKGPSGKIGFQVTIRYRDGTQETQFFAIA